MVGVNASMEGGGVGCVYVCVSVHAHTHASEAYQQLPCPARVRATSLPRTLGVTLGQLQTSPSVSVKFPVLQGTCVPA